MNPKLTLSEFEERSSKIHNNKYLYKEYIDYTTKVTITCKVHGDFLQTPATHLQGSGCPCCYQYNDFDDIIKGIEKKGFQFISKSNLQNIILKNKYGTYKTTIANLRKGSIPTIQSSINKTEVFINKSNEIHNNLYCYVNTNYINNSEKVKILCKIHGEFEQTPNNHLLGKGCKLCAYQNSCVFTETAFIKASTDLSTLYIIECSDEKEHFYKIGITTRTIKERFLGISKMPYNYKIIKEIKDTPSNIYKLEKQLHELNKDFRYKPEKSFGGSSKECFKEIVSDFS